MPKAHIILLISVKDVLIHPIRGIGQMFPLVLIWGGNVRKAVPARVVAHIQEFPEIATRAGVAKPQ